MKQEFFNDNLESNEVDSLLIKILNGSASKDEISFFSVWIKDVNNEIYFDKYRDMWHISTDSGFLESNVDKNDRERFISYVRSSLNRERNRRLWIRGSSVAASIALLLSVSYFTGLLDFKSSSADFNMLAYSQDSVRVELENGKRVKSVKNEGKSITNIDEIISEKENLQGRDRVESDDAVNAKVYNTVSTPAGERIAMVLSDGTKVYLTANSYLRYPSSFDKDKREVTVSGRAFFEVKKSKVPFVVKTADMNIEVLGTSFDVESKNTGDKASVILVEGSVKVISEGKTTFIKPDEQMNLSRSTKEIKIQNVDSKMLTMWKEGVLVVHGQSFSELIESLSSWYGVQIVDRTSVSQSEKFNGRFDREDIEAAIKAVSISAKISYKIESGKLILEDI